jgi:hypothetical protein
VTANGQTKAAPPELDPEILTILRAVADLDGVIATDGMVDLSVVVPEDVTYRVPLASGETIDYTVPGDVPFLLTLTFLRARDRFARAEAAMTEAEGEEGEEAGLEALERAWKRLVDALAAVLAIRHEGTTAEDLAEIPNTATRNLIGALFLRLMGLRLKPFSKELGEGNESPKAGEPPSMPGETEAASSS